MLLVPVNVSGQRATTETRLLEIFYLIIDTGVVRGALKSELDLMISSLVEYAESLYLLFQYFQHVPGHVQRLAVFI